MRLCLRTNFWVIGFGLAVLLLYGKTLLFGFVSDDSENILHPALQVGGNWQSLWSSFGGLYIPVTFTFWFTAASISRAFFDSTQEMSALPFHALNLFFHFLTVCLVFFLLRQRKFSLTAAGFGAFAFLIFPLQLEPVSWMTGLKDILGGFFGLLALWLFGKAGEERESRLACIQFVLASIAFLLAVLAKPSSVCILGMATLLLFWIFPPHKRLSIFILILWGALSLFIIFLTQNVQSNEDPSRLWGTIPSLSQRIKVALDAVIFYLKKIVWPLPLSFDNGRPPDVALSSHVWILGGLFFLFLILASWWRSLRSFVLAALIFAIGLLPTLGFIPFQFQQVSTVADRYAYLASLGIALFVASLIKNVRSSIVTGILCAVFLAWGIIDYRESSHWRSNETLFTHALKSNPKSWFALDALGDLRGMQQDYSGAEHFFRRSLEVNPSDAYAWKQLGRALYFRSVSNEEVFTCLMHFHEIKSEYLYHLSERLVAKKKWQAAENSINLALQHDPANQRARLLLEKIKKELLH